MEKDNSCPAEGVLKMLSGKWKPQIFRLALNGSIRFSSLLRDIEGSNKQSIAVALKELEEQGLLEKMRAYAPVYTQKWHDPAWKKA